MVEHFKKFKKNVFISYKGDIEILIKRCFEVKYKQKPEKPVSRWILTCEESCIGNLMFQAHCT